MSSERLLNDGSLIIKRRKSVFIANNFKLSLRKHAHTLGVSKSFHLNLKITRKDYSWTFVYGYVQIMLKTENFIWGNINECIWILGKHLFYQFLNSLELRLHNELFWNYNDCPALSTVLLGQFWNYWFAGRFLSFPYPSRSSYFTLLDFFLGVSWSERFFQVIHLMIKKH